MRNVRLLALAAVLALCSGFLVGHVTAPHVLAATPAVLKVKHCAGINNVEVTDGYTVKWRKKNQSDVWSEWFTATNAGQRDGTCSTDTTKAWRWQYETGALDPVAYPQVEWEVTVASGRAGSICSGSNVTNRDGSAINGLTYPGGTLTLTAGSYQ